MGQPWTITNRSAAGAPASASQAAAAQAVPAGAQVRLRSLQCSIQSVAAGTDQLVVRDGASGVGAILWQTDIQVAIGQFAMVQITGLDIRATPGNALTVEFVAGIASNREAVNAQGDFVPYGYPMGMP
jgi:hypothetical protein